MRITHPFLRPGFVVHIETPPDITPDESARLSRWLLTLAIDPPHYSSTAPREKLA